MTLNQSALAKAIAAAIAAYQAAIKTTDWIDWHGGECPVERGTIVDLKDQDGFVWEGVMVGKHIAVDNAFWQHKSYSHKNRIAAYRVVG